MRTAPLLPVSPSMHCSGGVPGPWGVPGPGGVHLVPGRVPPPKGVYLVPGGVYLVPRGCTWSQGCVPGPMGVPAQALPPWGQTHMCKNITFTNFVCRQQQESISVGCQLPACQQWTIHAGKARYLHLGVGGGPQEEERVPFEHVRGRSMYGEVQCIMANGHMGPPHPPDRQTDITENITFPTPLLGGNNSKTYSYVEFVCNNHDLCFLFKTNQYCMTWLPCASDETKPSHTFPARKNTTMVYMHRHMSHSKIDISVESEWSREKCYVFNLSNWASKLQIGLSGSKNLIVTDEQMSVKILTGRSVKQCLYVQWLNMGTCNHLRPDN